MFQPTDPPANLARVRFVAADMDNTLLDENGKLPELPDGVYDRVVALAERGVAFAIASGRPLVTLRALFPRLTPRILLIADNGGIICDKGHVIYQGNLPVGDYQRMVELAHANGDIGMVCAAEATYVERRYRHLHDELSRFFYAIDYVDDLSDVTARADKFTVYLPQENSIERREQVYGPAFGKEFSVVTSGSVWVDITPAGQDKGGAMRHASELLGIPLADMMAFGDTFNDAAMLETVGFGYMMANASPGMERHARYVAPSNAEHGVLRVIDQLLAAKNAPTA